MKIIPPSLLTLITTYMCTAECRGCCYGCSPRKSKKMSFSEMKKYIDHTVETFPSISSVVFTGGECTLLKEDLFKAIAYCSKKNIPTRIVTNGFWANSKENTDNIIKKLLSAGLKEINFSTGDFHQQYIPFNNILNAISVLVKSEIKTILITVEKSPEHQFKIDDILNNPNFLKLGKNIDRVILVESPWVDFKKLTNSNRPICVSNKNKGCTNLFSSININPKGELLSCCGFAPEYSPFLKLGKFSHSSLNTIYTKQFNDLFKLWLYTKGPTDILNFIENRNLRYECHPCELCFKLLTNKEYLNKILLKTEQKQVKKIISEYNTKTIKYEKQV